jgi:transcriptional regulator of arginine metabolism
MKTSRHQKILDIIDKDVIETQEELADRLKLLGMDVTQATVSRDIKDLGLVKVLSADGRYKYAFVGTPEASISNRLLNILTEAYVSSDNAMNIVVIKTLPGMAQAVASAMDSLKWKDVLGTIAGDDTLMTVCKNEEAAKSLVEEIQKLI